MKIKHLIVFLMFFSLFYIAANEKEVFDNNKISFNFNKTPSDAYKKTADKNDFEFTKKSNGSLAMGIIGSAILSFAVPYEFVAFFSLFYPIGSITAYILILSMPVCFAVIIGPAIIMIIIGLINYRVYKHKKTPNPFSSNKTSLIKFRISLKGAGSV